MNTSMLHGLADWIVTHVEDNGGITINPFTGGEPLIGYAVGAFPERGEQFRDLDSHLLEAYIQDNYHLLSSEGDSIYLGIWMDKENGGFLDIVRVLPDLEEATSLARECSQRAIYDLARKRIVWIT